MTVFSIMSENDLTYAITVLQQKSSEIENCLKNSGKIDYWHEQAELKLKSCRSAIRVLRSINLIRKSNMNDYPDKKERYE